MLKGTTKQSSSRPTNALANPITKAGIDMDKKLIPAQRQAVTSLSAENRP